MSVVQIECMPKASKQYIKLFEFLELNCESDRLFELSKPLYLDVARNSNQAAEFYSLANKLVLSVHFHERNSETWCMSRLHGSVLTVDDTPR